MAPAGFRSRAWGAVAALVVLLGSVAAAGGDAENVVLVGAGDIAGCAWSSDEATADLLDNIPGTVFTAGDNVYVAGLPLEYTACYDPSWGRHKARTRPAPGNHDYDTPGALGYFAYFGGAAGAPDRGYYAYRAGDWQVIVLNGECDAIGGCGKGSPQEQWLRSELTTRPADCTLAIFHYPLFNSGSKGPNPVGRDLWQALYEHDAEIVVSGDEHLYERFAPTDPAGRATAQGIRQFTVGTGGAPLSKFAAIQPNSEARIAGVYGVIELTLSASSYSWQFRPVAGQTVTDLGTAPCH